ncbi:MAG: serine/threonine-protein phosphatase [Sphingobacteriia bacterium]|nr:serine/threonine-protein phosphatase [Sphingobacteriia bacterium]NCC38504.1 serine/threonine-protein phosphatase [Gammaproteobacteria bacterium]
MSDAGPAGFALEYAWRTDRGRVRVSNEDSLAVDPECGLLIVADGMGGARAGEVASAMAVDVIQARYRALAVQSQGVEAIQALVVTAIAEASHEIFRLGREDPELRGMGTTVVVGAIIADRLVYAHVGDSRIYRLRGAGLVQLSHDHSLIQEVVDRGLFGSRDEARQAGIGEHILTRALGSFANIAVPVESVTLASGDLVLLCTDGLTTMIADDDLREMLIEHAGRSLGSVADSLVQAANARGGVDNITLALLRVVAR